VGDAFDPYREWLGAADGKPSTYYGLFGIELFEGDTGVIAHAADSLRTRIRSIRPGGHLAEWQGLLDEVAAGKSCLLNPDTKISYDAGLRGWAVPPPAAPAAAEPATAGPAGKPQMALPPGITASPSRWTESRDPISPVAIPTTRTAADSRLVATPPSSQNQDPSRTCSTMPLSYPMPFVEQSPQNYPPPLPLSPQGSGLSRDQAASSFPAMAAASMPQTAEAPADTPSVEALRAAVQTRGVPQRRMSNNGLMALALPILVVISLGSVGYVFFQDYQHRQAAARKGEEGEKTGVGASDAGRNADVTKAESPRALSSLAPLSSPVPPGQRGPAKIELAQAIPNAGAAAKPAAPPADPQKQAALKKALADARTALASRDLAAAKKCVEQASQNVQSGDDQNDVTRMDNLTKWVANFWELIGRRIAQLRPTDELEVGNTRVAIVEASANALVIRAAGQTRRYTLASLPAQLVTTVADQALAKDPASKVIFACFLLVDRHGDRQRARQLLAEAAQKGENAEPSLPPLDSFADAAPASGDVGGEVAKVAVDPAKVLQAEALVKQRFQEDLDAATTPLRKADLARKLVKIEPRTQDSVESQVALYHVALDLAVAAGKPEVVLQAADRMAEVGGGDALETKVAALEELVHSAHGFSAHRDIVLSALKLGPQAVTLGRAAEAGRLARLAAESAKKAQNPGLMRQAKAFAQQAAEMESQATK
jgi:hypothetical protein